MDELGRDDREAKPPTPLVEAKSERQSAVLVASVTLMIGAAVVTVFFAGWEVGRGSRPDVVQQTANKKKLELLFDQFRAKGMDGAQLYSQGTFRFALKNDSPESDAVCKKLLAEMKRNAIDPVWQAVEKIESADFYGRNDAFSTARMIMRTNKGQVVDEICDLSAQDSATIVEHFSSQVAAVAK